MKKYKYICFKLILTLQRFIANFKLLININSRINKKQLLFYNIKFININNIKDKNKDNNKIFIID